MMTDYFLRPGLRSTLTEVELIAYIATQLNNAFPDSTKVVSNDFQPAFKVALERLENCFSHVASKYFFDGTQTVFNHLHSDQYAMWLYILANELFRQNAAPTICSKLFLLNKMLNGCDIFYEVELPSVFLLVHPLGTVLGRAHYSDYFVAYQNCNVGSNRNIYPKLGKDVTMRPGSSILGNCFVGDMCEFAAGTLVVDRDVEKNHKVFGKPGSLRLKEYTKRYPLWHPHN